VLPSLGQLNPIKDGSIPSVPEIVSGRVLTKSGDENVPLPDAELKVTWDSGENTTSTDLKGIYSFVVEANRTITIQVTSPDNEYKELTRYIGRSISNPFTDDPLGDEDILYIPYARNEVKQYVGNTWGVSFYSKLKGASVATQNEDPSIVYDGMGPEYSLVSKDELSLEDMTNEFSVVYVGSDAEYNHTADISGYLGAVSNMKSFVEDGKVFISTALSSAFPAFINGGASPAFYNNFSVYHEPYGSAMTKTVNINNAQFRERLGGTTSVTLASLLPVSQHSMIDTLGASKILSTSTYIFRDLVTT
jgi:hypothetical protein